MPKRPRRFFLPILVLCLLVRLELFYQLSLRQQCTAPGLESYLCVLLTLYESYSIRRPRAPPPDANDPWGSVADDVRHIFSGSVATITNIIAVVSLGHAVYLATSQTTPSTYICSIFDSPGRVLAAQIAGLFLDALILILIWRILSWAKTTKTRLSTLGSALCASSIFLAVVVMGTHMPRAVGTVPNLRNSGRLDVLYALDVLSDGAALAVLVIAACLVMCETSPMTPVGIISLIIGMSQALHNVYSLGTWQRPSGAAEALIPIYLGSFGFIIHLYVNGTRSIIFIRRGFVVFLLSCLIVHTTIHALSASAAIIKGKHPLSQTVYDARINNDRWAGYAAFSTRVEVAADGYRKRNHGRDPPVGFDKWFRFAKDGESAIIDHFEQIGSDVLPFWGMDPSAIRSGIEKVVASPNVATVVVNNKAVTRSDVASPEEGRMLDQLVRTIGTFAEHLPDMVIPINLGSQPVVLASWEEKDKLTTRAVAERFAVLGRREPGVDAGSNRTTTTTTTSTFENPDGEQAPPVSKKIRYLGSASARDFGHMQAVACPPPHSQARSADSWNAGPLGQGGYFISDWEASLDTCAQSDMGHLHGFHMTAPRSPLFQDMVPVFSRYKTSMFSDMIIPLPEQTETIKDDWKEFVGRRNGVFWRPELEAQAVSGPDLRGNHAHRLLHMLNNASTSDTTTVLLPLEASNSPDKYRYSALPLSEAAAAIPMDVGIGRYSNCFNSSSQTDACVQLRLELGIEGPPTSPSDAFLYRFVVELDTPHSGPSPTLLSSLRSASVPLLGTIFRTWYTERLAAWVHFVPLDLRYRSFHSTVGYFVGMRGRDANGNIDDTKPRMQGNFEDGKWIAGQGKSWAARALREEDAAIYLFRLLLEWGRVASDNRDGMAYKGSAKA